MPRSTLDSRRSDQERADLIAALGDEYRAGVTSSQMIADVRDGLPTGSPAPRITHHSQPAPSGHPPERGPERGHAPLDRQHRTPRQGPGRGHRWRGAG